MSWSLDASQQGTYGSGNPFTQSITMGSAPAIVIAVLFINGTTARTGGAPTIGGNTMTDSSHGFVFDSGGECGVEIWYKIEPGAGSQTLSVPNTGGVSMDVSIMSFNSTGGSASVDQSNSASGTTANPSVTVASVTANALVLGGLGSGYRNVPTAGGAYTLVHTYDAGNQTWGSEYDLDAGSGGGVAVDFGQSADDWGLIGITFNEETASLPPVNKDTQLLWDIRNLVNKDLQALWDITILVNKDLQALWDLRNLVNKDTQLVWDMSGQVNKTIQVIYDITNLVGNNLQLVWDMLNLVNKDMQLVWDMEQVINKDVQLVWDMEGVVNKTMQALYDINNLVNKDILTPYDINNLVGQDIQVVWDMTELVNKDTQLVFDILMLANKDAQLVWDILSSPGTVNSDIQLVWDLNGNSFILMASDGKTFHIT